MHAVLVFPDISKYVDRIRMFAELSTLTDSFHLLTRPSYDPAAFTGRWGAIEVHHLDRTGRTAFQRAALRLSLDIVRSLGPGNSGIVIHDIIVGRLAIPYSLRPYLKRTHNVKNITSLYADNLGFVFDTLLRPANIPHQMCSSYWFYLRLYAFRLLTECASCWASDIIICNSPSVPERLYRHYGVGDKAVVLPTEIDTSCYSTDESYSRASVGLPDDKPVLLFVGDVRLIKGIYPLLESLRILRAQSLEFLAVFVGDVLPQDRAMIMDTVERYELQHSVSFRGSRPFAELLAHYATADVLLCPSLSEGSPRVVKEALLSGCPVISTDLPTIKQLDPTGQIIIQVPVNDASALARAVQAVLDNASQARLRADQGRRLVIQRHSLQAVASQHFRVYQSFFQSVERSRAS